MPKNKLFCYIKKQIDSGAYQQNEEEISLKNSTQGDSYVLVKLPLPKDRLILQAAEKTYELQNHHITVFETMNNNIKVLSAYHYTAIYRDYAGLRYRLHIYFNSQDIVAWEPLFEMESTKIRNSWENYPQPKLTPEFLQQAKNYTVPFISREKAEFRKQIRILEKEYERREALASEISATSIESEDYKKALVAMERMLEQLIALGEARQKQLQLIRRMKQLVEEKLAAKLEEQKKEKPQAEKHTKSHNPTSAAILTSKPAKKDKKMPKPKMKFRKEVLELQKKARSLSNSCLLNREKEEKMEAKNSVNRYAFHPSGKSAQAPKEMDNSNLCTLF